MTKRMVTLLAIVVGMLGVGVAAATPATGYYRYFGAWNYRAPAFVQAPAPGPLTGVQVDNATCESNHIGCGLYLCVQGRTAWGGIWGSRYCGYDKVYHPFRNVWLTGSFTVYSYLGANSPTGQYIYGTVFW